MERITVDGEELGNTTGTVSNPLNDGEQEVGVRVLWDSERDVILVERFYESATLVSEFEVVNDDTVRSKKPLNRQPDYVLKAVVAIGFENIHEPDWPN